MPETGFRFQWPLQPIVNVQAVANNAVVWLNPVGG